MTNHLLFADNDLRRCSEWIIMVYGQPRG